MSTTHEIVIRELDHRTNDGIDVTLLWNSQTDRVSISVEDGRYGERFELEVEPDKALDAFWHPYAYINSHDPTRTAVWLATDRRGTSAQHETEDR